MFNCLLSAKILVHQMQIRGERNGYKAVRLRADAHGIAVTNHYLLTLSRTGRIKDI